MEPRETFRRESPSNEVMKYVRTLLPLSFAALFAAAPAPMGLAQMHKVAAPDQVTRAVGVYEYVGDLKHPKAARLIPVSLFIGGHFEDAGVYMARPIPFALDGGLRYELQHGGVRQDYLDVIASRNFANSAAAATQPFDDGWFGYGRIAPPPKPKATRLRPNCGNAHVVQETDNTKKDDSRPHFGTKPADGDKPADTKPADTASNRKGAAAPDPCREEIDDKPDKVTLSDDRKPGDNSPDPERPTLHRSPETTANNTGSNGKSDKKPPKQPNATITANKGAADDPDRPTIRHRTADEDDPNALPPDPLELSSRETAKAAADKAAAPKATPATTAATAAARSGANDTVGEGGTIQGGDTMSGGPRLQRGHVSAPPPEPAPVTAAAKPAGKTVVPSLVIPQPLDAVVAVSDARERAAHDFSYHFGSNTERAAAVTAMEAMAQAVLANPALATDAPEGVVHAAPAAAPTAPAPKTATAARTAAGPGTPAARARAARAHAAAASPANTTPVLADEEMNAYQLYYSAPISYTLTARVAATATAPERFVTVIATTDAEGKLQVAMRSVTDAGHLDRTPRYRLIDVVDADGSNRASLLMELRAQHSRQFALYRLLGSKPDQIFVSGSTLL